MKNVFSIALLNADAPRKGRPGKPSAGHLVPLCFTSLWPTTDLPRGRRSLVRLGYIVSLSSNVLKVIHLNQLISKFVLSFWLAALKKKPEASFDMGSR